MCLEVSSVLETVQAIQVVIFAWIRPGEVAHQDLKHPCGARKVIFLDQFEKSPGVAPGGSQKKMFEPCNISVRERDAAEQFADQRKRAD